MWLMDDITICDKRARDIRIWQINAQNVRVRKIWKTWFLSMGPFSWQNVTYSIQFILTIYINSEKPMLPGRCAPDEFFSWKCGKLRKTAKSGYPALIWPFRTSLWNALYWNKISHVKLQSLKMFKTTKDMFYKQFDFFLWIDRADYEPCPLANKYAQISFLWPIRSSCVDGAIKHQHIHLNLKPSSEIKVLFVHAVNYLPLV